MFQSVGIVLEYGWVVALLMWRIVRELSHSIMSLLFSPSSIYSGVIPAIVRQESTLVLRYLKCLFLIHNYQPTTSHHNSLRSSSIKLLVLKDPGPPCSIPYMALANLGVCIAVPYY